MGCVVLGAILFGRRSRSLIVAQAFLLFNQLLVSALYLMLTSERVLVGILCFRIARHLLKRLAAVVNSIKVYSVHTVWQSGLVSLHLG